MLLTELFSGPSTWKWTEDSQRYAQAVFAVDDLRFEVSIQLAPQHRTAAQVPSVDPTRVWIVEFGLINGPGNHYAFDITGTGKAVVVFATVVALLKEFAKARGVAAYQFSAGEPSRRRLYDRLASRLGTSVVTFVSDYEKRYFVTI